MKNTKDVVEMMMAMMDKADKDIFKGLFNVMLELGIGEEDEPNKVAKPVKLLAPGSVKVEKVDIAPEYIKDKSRKDRVREDALHRTKDCGGKKKNRTREEYKKNHRNHMDRLYEQGIYIGDTVKNRRYAQKMDALERGADDNALAEQDVLLYMGLVEEKERCELLVQKLTRECEALQRIHDNMVRHLSDEVYNQMVSGVIFRYFPGVNIESYAPEALKNAKGSLAEVTAELERYF